MIENGLNDCSDMEIIEATLELKNEILNKKIE
jgi:hypothetical protein